MGGFSALLAVDDGLINLDDPAWHYLPEWHGNPDRTAIKVKDLIDPSITCPISLQVCDDEILCEEDDLVSLDPTEEVDLEHPRVMLPSPRPLGAVPMEHIRPAGPEETTVVEGIRGRPKHYRT